jgi:hypothetical protein
MSDTKQPQGKPSDGAQRTYEPPAIEWEEQIDVKANLASACEKVGGTGEPCDSASMS